MEFSPTWNLLEALEAAAKEKLKVEVQLRGGGTLAGSVGGVGGNFVVLTKLTGREFYDAFVKIEDISAVIAQGRKK